MRVCIIGDQTPPLDEGMKKTTASLAAALAARSEILVLNPLSASSLSYWRDLLRFRPQIIHYVPGPSFASFVLLWLAKNLTRSRTVMSLTHPDPKLPRRLACSLFPPDLLLAQSEQSEEQFANLGPSLEYVPNGVDLTAFQPVSVEQKAALRQKHTVPLDAYVTLHVGNTRGVRNLGVMAKLQEAGCQSLIVSSTTIQGDAEVDNQLQAAGCLVWNRYIERIDEIYKLADCYVFPVEKDLAAIEHPLSVLEAMACNLPVVTRRFGALPRVFKEGGGLHFADSNAEIVRSVLTLRQQQGAVDTVDKVRTLDWRSLADTLMEHYSRLLGGPRVHVESA